ncbi:MAG TPA: hypothetical protein VGB97_00435 [Candidatus Paceibacterota bacterium]
MARGILAAIIVGAFAMFAPPAEAFDPKIAFVLVCAALAFLAAYSEIRALYFFIAGAVLVLASGLAMPELGFCACAFGLALIFGAFIRVVIKALNRPTTSSAG